ncbi:hypothetical protein FA15DRAFT_673296 [Coprinopsis marcescibilis]|uniref:F-box domain-containing protein n=1 Tax=Coprinopsis marcescibilis TaxID=230819 RepID=A0A5C3KL25_COPMA|nr:hypothetical protein FA15DRAFT_673296 [Coprinopsis marcescibilis]
MVTGFPAELIREIVSHLPEEIYERPSRLSSLSRVSSQFREPCQQKLFSHLHLYPPGPPRSRYVQFIVGKRLLWLLDNSTMLKKYTKTITINEEEEWLKDDPKITEALTRINALGVLRELRLHDTQSLGGLELDLREVITSICSSPNFSSLFIQTSDDSLASSRLVKASISTLKRLEVHLYRLTPGASRFIPPNEGQPQPQLQLESFVFHVEAGVCAETLDYVLEASGGSMKTLQALHVLTQKKQLSAVILAKIASFAYTATDLRRLTYELPFNIDDYGRAPKDTTKDTILDLSKLGKLKSISITYARIQSDPKKGDSPRKDPFLWVLRLFQTIPPSFSLESVHLVIQHFYYDASFPLESAEANFHQLDALLSDREKLPFLRNVTIDLYFHARHVYFKPDIASRLQREISEYKGAFATLHRRRLLNVRTLREMHGRDGALY